MGDNYREVDLTANALINVGAIHESPALNSSTYSINSTNLTTKTLYTFQSDTIGNITNVGGVVNLDWNGRRLESISQGGTVVASYDYNIDGQRISKTVNGVITEYFYNGDILAGQKTGDDVLIFMYDNNGDIFGFTYNGTPYYYVKNAQNDVFLILDENGQAVVLYFYDAWGRVVSGFDGTDFGLIAINPIMYRSYYVDLEMGMFMYYLNSRYYMADWGRFVSADSYVQTGQGMLDKNMFAYCGNNPVMFRDPSGCCYEITIPAVGSGPVIVTDSNGNSYSYNAPRIGNTYFFDEKQFKKDLVNATLTQKLEPIVQSTAEIFADTMIDKTLSAINNANLTYLIPYGHEINAVSSGFGLASLVSVGLQVVWDYENYGNDWKSHTIASLITLASFGLTIGAGLLIASCNPVAVVGVAMALCSGVAISTGAELAREAWLPKEAKK